MVIASYQLGKLKLSVISDGCFWLDGGSMFGVVPKVLWSKVASADNLNRVRLAVNTLLIQTSGKNILVDTGLGEEISEKFKEIYLVERPVDLMQGLEKIGVKAGDIDFVINTHLHFDHAGWNTVRKNKKYVPAFPNAKYVMQKREWDDANNPNERTRASYDKKNFMALAESGQLKLVEGDCSVVQGVRILNTVGHTSGHQSVLIGSEGETAIWLGDLIPTAAHVKIAYITGFDLFPLDIIEQKKKIINQAIKEHWLLIFEHDPGVIFAYIEEENGVQILKPLKGENLKFQNPITKQVQINQYPSMKPYNLKERTFLFTKEVIEFLKTLPKTPANFEYTKQLIRSSGSIGSNYIEADEALGKKDFLMRIRICRKESKESAYWLRLIECSNPQIDQRRASLMDEALQFVKIFNSIIEKAK